MKDPNQQHDFTKGPLQLDLDPNDQVEFLQPDVGPRERFAVEILCAITPSDSHADIARAAAAHHLAMFFSLSVAILRPEKE